MAKRFKKGKTAGDGDSAKVANPDAFAQQLSVWLSRDWFLGLILLLAVFLSYQAAWSAGFVWDDDTLLTANPCIIGSFGLKGIWTTSAADICPLTITTFWVEHALWGLAPLPYHLVNVLLHGVCAILLWRVLLGLCVPGAWLGAALWAVHPVQVESVAWITEMKNTESCLFYLLSILFFMRWLSARNLNGKTEAGWNYALTLLFAALAMTSKSSTVILPVILCLCAWWMEGRWQWRNLARVTPIFFMSIAASALSIWTQGLRLATAVEPQWVRTWPERLAAAGDAVWFYLGKLLWPQPLIAVYPRWDIDAGRWVSYLSLLAVIVVLFIFWLKRATWSRPCFFAFTYFLVTLLPALGLLDTPIFRYSLVFDHFQYLASMGPLALAGAGMVEFANFVIPKKAWVHASLGAGLLLVLGTLSWQRAWVYESEETLWTDTLTQNPNCWAAYANLGNVFVQKGQMDEAMALFQRALVISPHFAQAHTNLGVALFKKGQMDEAVAQFQNALEINPNLSEAHNNLGLVLLQKGQVDEAMAQFQKALKIDPNYAAAHHNLGLAFFQKGQVDETILQFQEVIRLNSGYDNAQNDLTKALEIARQRAQTR